MIEPIETPLSNTEDREELKRKLAYLFWEDEGRPDGCAEAHWEKACLVVMSLDAKMKNEPEWLQRSTESPDQTTTPSTARATLQADVEKTIEAIRKEWAQVAA